MDGGLGGQDSSSKRNRVNGVSPLRSFLQNKNAFSQDAELFKKPLLGGGKNEKGNMAMQPSKGQWVVSSQLCSLRGSLEVKMKRG